MLRIVSEIWLFRGFSFICDFFGALGSFASFSVMDITLWLQGRYILGDQLLLTWTNIMTGEFSFLYLTSSWFTKPIGYVLDVITWLLPTNVEEMPLYAGILVASVSWFFVLALLKFFKNLF